MRDFCYELFMYFRVRKKYWLIPIAVFLLIIALMIIVGPVSVVAPFVYTIF